MRNSYWHRRGSGINVGIGPVAKDAGGRHPKNEDPFCMMWYVNVIQDYAGGGTYGAPYARYISLNRVACSAGQ